MVNIDSSHRTWNGRVSTPLNKQTSQGVGVEVLSKADTMLLHKQWSPEASIMSLGM